MAAAGAEANEPVDPVADTTWALADVARVAATAAVRMHLGGVSGMPGDDRG